MDISLYGIVGGNWEDPDTQQIMHISRFEEKPEPARARKELRVTYRAKETYFSFFGQYILTPEIYARLSHAIAEERTENGEYQLTSAFEEVRLHTEVLGLRIDGRKFDIGVPEQYRRTVADYGNKNLIY
jgi:UTP-glucose-1-phosphate uridylyltransferase